MSASQENSTLPSVRSCPLLLPHDHSDLTVPSSRHSPVPQKQGSLLESPMHMPQKLRTAGYKQLQPAGVSEGVDELVYGFLDSPPESVFLTVLLLPMALSTSDLCFNSTQVTHWSLPKSKGSITSNMQQQARILAKVYWKTPTFRF